MNKVANKYVFAKLVVCGDSFELSKYKYPIYSEGDIFSRSRDSENEKRSDNVQRAIRRINLLIKANLTPHTKFLTLTYKNTMLDLKTFENDFKNFLRAMKYHGYPLMYLYVIERQKERGEKEGNIGTIHAHLVVFNDEKIPLDILNRCWKHGRSEIHILNGLKYGTDEFIRDVAAYITKYISKDGILEFGRHSYRCSLGLNKPYELKLYVYGDSSKMLGVDDEEEAQKQYDELLSKLKVLGMEDYPIKDYEGNLINHVDILKGKVLSDVG